ncbi:metalloprotease [Trichoderma reesei RUT C-30]|uniref:Metalloprotease n=1 Tax=Hypocrea jecorina (strain ATCC 56765 / BCRC 32924 / NRRL 11460 / Rut C-30) TaxID=1344414 RepID=A0A024SF97_HYPJR|nr:metalloprotease [Trichoderma reesei RUT C-30]
MSCRCYIVPPHLFRAIAQSPLNPEHVRKAAEASLAAHDHISAARQERTWKILQEKKSNRNARVQASPFVPESLLQRLSASDAVDEASRTRAKRDLRHLQGLMGRAKQGTQEAASRTVAHNNVYNASNTWDDEKLPGRLERAQGEPPAKDLDVNKAYDNVGHVLRFYEQHFGWKSIDNQNAPVTCSVHFGEHYGNAFWSPETMQMVFGDGNMLLCNFTGCVDVIGHELAHAVTDNTSPLDYSDQAGALNEHISDVFGIMAKQQVENETSEEADWLIGEDCLLPDVKGVAFRSMKEPGKAYDDERFGKDPQVDSFAQWEAIAEDRGGVHIFSGIPNKAFYLSAVAFGGYSWEIAGKIWWRAMNCGKVPPRCTFQQFADITVECAEELFDVEAAKLVRQAWNTVGVIRGI